MPLDNLSPSPLLYGDVPQAVVKMAEEFASKLLTEHQHCLNVTDMRYSVVPKKQHGSYEFLARIFFTPDQSCTHKATFSLGTHPDADVSHLAGQNEATSGVVQS